MSDVIALGDLIRRPQLLPWMKGCQTLMAERLAKFGFCHRAHGVRRHHQPLGPPWQRRALFCFAGHTDVVPAGLIKWHPPFEPTIQDGMLYGRGAADMKGSSPPWWWPPSASWPNTRTTRAHRVSHHLRMKRALHQRHGARHPDTLERATRRSPGCIVGEPSSTAVVGTW